MLFYGWNVALSQFYLPLPIVHTINGSGAIFIFVIDYFRNGVHINMKQLAGVMIGFIGLVATVNGKLIISYLDPTFEAHSEFENYHSDGIGVGLAVSTMLVLSNFGWGYSIVYTKDLHYHPYQISYHCGILLVLASSLIYISLGNFEFDFQKMLICFFLTGVPCALTALAHVTAVKMTKRTGILFIINFSTVLLGYLVSIFYYNESQNLVCSIGVVLVVAGVSLAIYHKDDL